MGYIELSPDKQMGPLWDADILVLHEPASFGKAAYLVQSHVEIDSSILQATNTQHMSSKKDKHGVPHRIASRPSHRPARPMLPFP
jgi:hypothetical protein